jgi:hypothetical protein
VSGEITLYQRDDGPAAIEVRLEDDTVWVTQAQLVELFQSSKANISQHIKNVFQEGELDPEATVRDFRTVREEGPRRVERAYLDAVKRAQHRLEERESS